MGKIRSISVHSKYNHTNDVVGGKVGNVVMHSLDCLIGPRQKTLYVHDIGLCKRVFAAGGPVLLQFISLWGLPDKPEPIALIKSCAGTLERLHISSPNQAAILKLTCEGAGTFVYPRLKHLLLSNNPEMRDSTRQQPSADPFPQLETLVCLMRYPFSSPVVLAGGQSHIRHLRLWMDADMYEVHQGVFARGAFQKLQSVSLEWLGYNDGDIYDDNVLLETSLALSAATQVVCLRSMRLTQTKEIFASVTLPDMLQSLCLDNTFLETDEIMAIFCACRALQKASVCLGDVSHGEPGYSNTHINEYHTRYDGCGTSVRYIGIWDTSPACDSTKAEAVVMLVSLLPRVVRVSVAPRVVPLAHQAFIEYLAHSRNRSIYKDRFHLDHVQFAINNCW
ncbi:hypothetical protein GGF46_002331 [Coemansia sp. RSA 552]|nr:hypothetical protein GGF46_002331 [Coemansia sp. RSA 552]